jgi:hypothetical protein
VEEISRHPSIQAIQAVALILLSTFSQVYSKNREQKIRAEKIEKYALRIERKCIQGCGKEDVKEIVAIKKKL